MYGTALLGYLKLKPFKFMRTFYCKQPLCCAEKYAQFYFYISQSQNTAIMRIKIVNTNVNNYTFVQWHMHCLDCRKHCRFSMLPHDIH